LPDRLEVLDGILFGVGKAVEEVEGLGAVGFGGEQIVERQPEFLAELADGGVSLVDEFAAAFDDLAVVKAGGE
jgi:hypothetical protein